jgi:coenzyme F420-0:L-glutamate ligase/coenzyme F420-1:gamma-L-glutamate ligase
VPLNEVRIRGLLGIPEIRPGDDLAREILRALTRGEGSDSPHSLNPLAGAVFVVAQKAVSKAEGRIIKLDSVEPSPKARQWAAQHDKDARVVEIILRESRRIVRMERGILIAETRHGFICANAGVDASNVPAGCVSVLPEDPDDSARRLRAALALALEVPLGVIISDTFGRPWRMGQANVALGVSGLCPLIDYRGRVDSSGRTMQATVIALADELAAAAELVMGKTLGIPVAVIEGLEYASGQGSARDLIRPPEEDLFR